MFHDTYFVVAHFHYVMAIAAIFAMFAGWYYWIGKMSGKQYNETLGKIQFWMFFVGVNVSVLPAALCWPCRYAAPYSGLSGCLCGLELCQFGGRIDHCGGYDACSSGSCTAPMRRVPKLNKTRGVKVRQRLEWHVPSPAPFHTFEDQPDMSGKQPAE